MLNVFLVSFCFLCGAVPFSYLLGLILDKDIRDYGEDRNPGAANSFKAGGAVLGIPSLALDFLKGAVPVFFVDRMYDVSSITLILVCIAPVLGHMFTPILRFKGGKGITTTFGIWSGLMLWEVPLYLGSVFTVSLTIKYLLRKTITDEFIVILASSLLPVFVFFQFHNRTFFILAVLNSVLLILGQFREKLGI
jgi:glycerol-3-phosphate acyltransferase PlsY